MQRDFLSITLYHHDLFLSNHKDLRNYHWSFNLKRKKHHWGCLHKSELEKYMSLHSSMKHAIRIKKNQLNSELPQKFVRASETQIMAFPNITKIWYSKNMPGNHINDNKFIHSFFLDKWTRNDKAHIWHTSRTWN